MHSDFHRRCRTGGRIGLRREYRIVAMSQPLCVFCRRHPIEQLWRPFCSERCKLQDLARWAEGAYRVAAEPVSDTDESDDESQKAEG